MTTERRKVTSNKTKNLAKLELFKNMSSNTIGEKTSEYLDENKTNVIGSYFLIKNSNIGVVSKIKSSVAYEEAERLKIILMITSAFALIFSLVFCVPTLLH